MTTETRIEKPKRRFFIGKTSPHMSAYEDSKERNFYKKALRFYKKGANIMWHKGEKFIIGKFVQQ
jgi:hypothetical protein